MAETDTFDAALQRIKFGSMSGSLVSTRKPRQLHVAICGHGRCGKDTVSRWLDSNTSLVYSKSTSEVIIPYAAKRLGLTEEETYRRRHEFRQVMYMIGNELREQDPAFLAREVLKTGSIANGIRDRAELETVINEGLVDLAIWVDRDVPEDPTLKYGPELCDIVIPNRWGFNELFHRLHRLSCAMGVCRPLHQR